MIDIFLKKEKIINKINHKSILNFYKKYSVIFLPICPFLGYSIAYVYQYAYFSQFHIPLYLITININNIVQSICSLIFFTFFFLFIITIPELFKFFIDFYSPVGRASIRILYVAAYLVFYSFLIDFNDPIYATILNLVFMGLYVCFELVLPIFLQNKGKNYSEKLFLFNKKYGLQNYERPYQSLFTRNPVQTLILIFVLSLIGSYVLGIKQAINFKEHLVFKYDDNNYYILVSDQDSKRIAVGIEGNVILRNMLILPYNYEIKGSIKRFSLSNNW